MRRLYWRIWAMMIAILSTSSLLSQPQVKNRDYPIALNRHHLNGLPSFIGQYGSLLELFRCRQGPSSRTHKYGNWSDLGQQKQGYLTPCKKDGKKHRLSPGYTVWVYPEFYVWQNKRQTTQADKISSLAGLYTDLIEKRRGLSGDALYAGRVFDAGYNHETWQPGYGKMKKGYRVYHAGYWYTWKSINIPYQLLQKEIRYASNKGQYRRLQGILHCPVDGEWYGKQIFPRHPYAFEKTCQQTINIQGPVYKVYVYPFYYYWQKRTD